MKNLLIAFFTVYFISPVCVNAFQVELKHEKSEALTTYDLDDLYEFELLSDGYYGQGTISPDGHSLWKYYVSSEVLGVFTLKNSSRSSDIDIFIYSDPSLKYRIGSGTKSGSTTELITISKDYGGYVYIKIKNAGSYTTKYKLNAHQVDYFEMVGDMLIEAAGQYVVNEFVGWLVGEEDSEDSSGFSERDLERVSNVIFSTISGESFSGVAKNLAYQELTTELRNAFGYGFWGDLLVNFTINVFSDIYRYY